MVFPVSTSPLNIASMPSRSSASANFLSVLTRACTSSLKGLVLAIIRLRLALPALTLLVSPPIVMGRFDVPLLQFLCSARQQNHDRVAVSPKINPVTWPEIDLVFQHALSNAFHIGEIPLLHAGYRTGDLGACYRVQSCEPVGEGRGITQSNVVTDFKHTVR